MIIVSKHKKQKVCITGFVKEKNTNANCIQMQKYAGQLASPWLVENLFNKVLYNVSNNGGASIYGPYSPVDEQICFSEGNK